MRGCELPLPFAALVRRLEVFLTCVLDLFWLDHMGIGGGLGRPMRACPISGGRVRHLRPMLLKTNMIPSCDLKSSGGCSVGLSSPASIALFFPLLAMLLSSPPSLDSTPPPELHRRGGGKLHAIHLDGCGFFVRACRRHRLQGSIGQRMFRHAPLLGAKQRAVCASHDIARRGVPRQRGRSAGIRVLSSLVASIAPRPHLVRPPCVRATGVSCSRHARKLPKFIAQFRAR